ncbi:MAG: hypothetical protein R3D34_17535 [Nitratireductor sp.]
MSRVNPFSCEACRLADCDYMHRECNLKRAASVRTDYNSAKDAVPAFVEAAASEWNLLWKIDDMARKSEAGMKAGIREGQRA